MRSIKVSIYAVVINVYTLVLFSVTIAPHTLIQLGLVFIPLTLPMDVNLHSLQHLHTFSLPAYCSNVSTANSVDSLISLLSALSSKPYLVIGEGSNTVFVEDYLADVVVNKVPGIAHTQNTEAHYLRVGAGENWHALVEYCMQNNIGGFENLALIPGTVGASPIQNIGAYGVEVERFVESVEFIETSSMSLQSLPRSACEFAYRDSIFKRQTINQRIITHVNFRLPKCYSLETSYGPLANIEQPTARKIFAEVINIRRSKLPDVDVLGNAGSFFKNPVIDDALFNDLQRKYPNIPFYNAKQTSAAETAPLYKIPAAWLIDQLGFKGAQEGQIACHINQPLVLVNLGKGLGEDVLILARKISKAVQEHFGVQLEHEVRLVGKQGGITL